MNTVLMGIVAVALLASCCYCIATRKPIADYEKGNRKIKALPFSRSLLKATAVDKEWCYNEVGNCIYYILFADTEHHQKRFKVEEGMYEYVQTGQCYTMISDKGRICHIDGYSNSAWCAEHQIKHGI